MRIPSATYRVQFNSGFGFKDAAPLVSYLQAVGISDLYASPILKARKGSTHGYDVTDPGQLNPELGTPAEFDELTSALSAAKLGLLLDIVPNHMAASSENPWWTDVLENGQSSPYAAYFDVEWERPERATGERIWLPILGGGFGTVLEEGLFSLTLEEAGFKLHYYASHLPVDPKTYGDVLGEGGPAALAELRALVAALPPRNVTDSESLTQRRVGANEIKNRLWQLYSQDSTVHEWIDAQLTELAGRKGESRSFDRLEALLSEQPYSLAYWLSAREQINYRRFFDVTDLIGIRVEDRPVYEASHALIFEYMKQGRISGLRIDHIDGLYNPVGYLERLRESSKSAYVVVEKILSEDEKVPEDWPICGTVGYDFLGAVTSVLVDPAGLHDCTHIYERFTGIAERFSDIVYEKKKKAMQDLFAAETLALGLHLASLAEQDRHGRDLSPKGLRKALIELIACLPVYRTYIRESRVDAQDRKYLEQAFTDLRRRNPEMDPLLIAFLERVVSLGVPGALTFVLRWQQMTGPVMAKGNEDTALYVYNRLISMNDVGSRLEPLSVAAFHDFNRHRRNHFPHSLNATSTHDTKRSEDVRARIHVLAELSKEWGYLVQRWKRWNEPRKQWRNGIAIPDANDEFLIYQSLLGAWPFHSEDVPEFQERLKTYLRKALREAKTHTNWLKPDEEYENGCMEFVEAILREEPGNKFLPSFLKLERRVAFYGALNSLSQVLLKITSPGVPDFYQSTLLWDLSLVDPDNRRPVDFSKRFELIRDIQSWEGLDLFAHWREGGIKLFLSMKAQGFRNQNRELFNDGEYLPLQLSGVRQTNAIVFARRLGDRWSLTIAPRLTVQLSAVDRMPLGRIAWRDTVILLPHDAPTIWRNVLTGEECESIETPTGRELSVRDALRSFPVALLAT